MMLRKIVIAFTVCILSAIVAKAQVEISGTVRDAKKAPVPGMNVMLGHAGSAAILAFGIADAEGRFSIKITSEADSLVLKTTHLLYAPVTQVIANTSQQIDLQVVEEAQELKEVLIESEQLFIQKGDTLVFNPEYFKGKDDQVISDVLKRIPGIEVKTNGQILFQGKPIEKFYVEGLDLMEGRYGVVTENLPASAVKEVEVLQNHQSVKMLDSLESSDRASINIKLKKGVSVTGSGHIGGGLSPFLWDAKCTPMLFTKKFQSVISYQGNNIGEDVQPQLLNHGSIMRRFGAFGERPQDNDKWLSLISPSPPAFDSRRWLNNKAHLGSANVLFKIGKDFQAKAQISYSNDFRELSGASTTRFSTPTGEVSLREEQHNQLMKRYFEGRLFLTKNTKENYLKNELYFKRHWDNENGLLINGSQNIEQSLQTPNFKVGNVLDWMVPLGKKVLNLKSEIHYFDNPQTLRLRPSTFIPLSERQSEKTVQELFNSNLFTDHFVKTSGKIGGLRVGAQVGAVWKEEHLSSRLSLDTLRGTEAFVLGASYQNNLRTRYFTPYLKTRIEYKRPKRSITLQLPIRWLSFHAEDLVMNKTQSLSRLLVEPELNIYQELSTFWKVGGAVKQNIDIGTARELYFGSLLTDYRSLSQNDAPVSVRQNRQISTYANLSNTLDNLFFNVNYSFTRTKNNLIFDAQILENGASLRNAFHRNNFGNRHNIGARISHFFSAIESNASLSVSGMLGDREVLLNGETVRTEDQSVTISPEFAFDGFSWLGFDYKSTFSLINSYIDKNKVNNLNLQSHLFKVRFFPKENQYFGVENEYYVNDFATFREETFFVHLKYSLDFPKRKLTFVFRVNNLLNTKVYTQAFSDGFTFYSSTFNLRPRQAMLRVKFRF